MGKILDWIDPPPPPAASSRHDDSVSGGDDAEIAECERQCDLEWDRNKFMCDSDAAMRGYDKKRWKQCMDIVDQIYIECIQNCSKKCRK